MKKRGLSKKSGTKTSSATKAAPKRKTSATTKKTSTSKKSTATKKSSVSKTSTAVKKTSRIETPIIQKYYYMFKRRKHNNFNFFDKKYDMSNYILW